MINELIEQIGGRDRLGFIAEDCAEARFSEIEAMARALLAVLDAKPVGVTISPTIAAMDGVSQVGIEVYTIPPAASVPNGWKLVPLEPHWSMIDAAIKHHEGQAFLPVSLYKAMLAAAPAPGGE